MIREIIFPTSNSYTLLLPDNLIGKEVEVLAFEVEESSIVAPTTFLKKASSIFDNCKVDLSNYKFNRDEANDYE
jgi:hypothetical protein